ncbi:hypothetical protein FB451DRAFT_1177955 [Mycena latifolia]|nr:hypothetical protein FB451DRAFT_1177955 [Mycena latifolia]
MARKILAKLVWARKILEGGRPHSMNTNNSKLHEGGGGATHGASAAPPRRTAPSAARRGTDFAVGARALAGGGLGEPGAGRTAGSTPWRLRGFTDAGEEGEEGGVVIVLAVEGELVEADPEELEAEGEAAYAGESSGAARRRGPRAACGGAPPRGERAAARRLRRSRRPTMGVAGLRTIPRASANAQRSPGDEASTPSKSRTARGHSRHCRLCSSVWRGHIEVVIVVGDGRRGNVEVSGSCEIEMVENGRHGLWFSSDLQHDSTPSELAEGYIGGFNRGGIDDRGLSINQDAGGTKGLTRMIPEISHAKPRHCHTLSSTAMSRLENFSKVAVENELFAWRC